MLSENIKVSEVSDILRKQLEGIDTCFAFVDRTDVVNLNAYVSGGVRNVEGSYSYIFSVVQCRALLLYSDIQIRLCHLCQCVQTSLEIFFLAFQNKFEISSQWVSVKCRNEDAFWLGIVCSIPPRQGPQNVAQKSTNKALPAWALMILRKMSVAGPSGRV